MVLSRDIALKTLNIFVIICVFQISTAPSVEGCSQNNNATCPPPPPPKPKPPRGNGGKETYRRPREKQGKYWLVPPFLIGASSVVIVYVIVNCFYIHCYAKKKLQCLVAQPQQGIVIGDLSSSPTPLTPLTPLVHFDGGYGRTELVSTPVYFSEAQFETSDIFDDEETSDATSQCLLRPPEDIANGVRRSVCSATAVLSGPRETGEKVDQRRYTRPSICYVPLTRAISDPTAGMPNSRSSSSNIMFSPLLVAQGQNAGGGKEDTSQSASPIYQGSRYLLVPPVQYGNQGGRKASIVSMVPLIVPHDSEDGFPTDSDKNQERRKSAQPTFGSGTKSEESQPEAKTQPAAEQGRRQSVIEGAGGQQYLLVPAGTVLCPSSRRSSMVGMLPVVFPEPQNVPQEGAANMPAKDTSGKPAGTTAKEEFNRSTPIAITITEPEDIENKGRRPSRFRLHKDSICEERESGSSEEELNQEAEKFLQ